MGLGLTRVGIVGAAAAASVERGIAADLVTASAQLGTTIGLELLTSVISRFGSADSEQLAVWRRAAFVSDARTAVISVVTALVSTRPRGTVAASPAAIYADRRPR